ncbi:hypothetical protein [Actinomyces trachealis]|uniref:hypothetical protein n=1 Tax=Actinomyces trachealis TaxID=2763540 RepID=UPI001892AD98|nr:hypothetical protein [Actinomyces trachealis]
MSEPQLTKKTRPPLLIMMLVALANLGAAPFTTPASAAVAVRGALHLTLLGDSY